MWLSGYRRAVHGTPFPYHSFAPEISAALLVRANRERPGVEWETERVPVEAGPEDGAVRFVWAFALDASPSVATFTLHVNGEPVLTFENPRSADSAGWSFPGEGGAALRFRVTHRDRHGDPMGFAILSLPAAGLPPGEPVRLRVTAEDTGQSTWYMTFVHEVLREILAEPVPLVRRAEGEDVQWVRLVCTHLGEDGEIVVSADGREVVRGPVRFGRNTVRVPLPAVSAPRPVTLLVTVAAEEPQEVSFLLEPVKRWTIHMVQHTHTDIGYTRPQTEILPEHLRFIDDALDLVEETDGWPEDARFRWTCEASWPVREYLSCRPPAQIERLRRRVAEGRIELTGLMFNLSEIPDEAALAALLEPVKRLRGAGLPVRLAMQNDVNGLAWCLADYLPTVGIDSFVMGQHSHRALACFTRPTVFWWESPSGSRVLGFRADHYMTGNEWGIHGTDLEAFEEAMLNHLSGLEESGYPFPRIAIQFSGYLTDNAPPSLHGPETIRRWNETYLWPRLRSATAGEFLDWVRENHGGDLPVHRKAWPDWWTDGFGSAARETAAARRTQADLIATQGIAAVAAGFGLGVPEGWTERAQAAYDAVLFYDEHTLGAAESISDPTCENSEVQWAEKAAYAWEAIKRTRLLREAALGWLAPALPRRKEPVIVVVNSTGFARSGLLEVYIDHQHLPPDRSFRILDAEDREVAAQPLGSRSDGTYWLLGARDVPALGFQALRIAVNDEPRSALPRFEDTTLENEHYRLELDPDRGTVRSLVDKSLDLDLVDGGADWGLLDVIYERLADRNQLERKTLEEHSRTGLIEVRVEPGPDGPIYSSIVVSGTIPGGSEERGVRVEVRLMKESKGLQVACAIRKLAVTEPEGLYVAFPFRLKGGEIAFDVPGGLVVPGKDQLPGSSSDWNTVQSFARVRNERAEVLISCDGAPLWQLGGLNLGEFRYVAKVERPHLYSWVMNNYWVTNFCASQEGEFRWTYDLTSGPARGPAAAARFGQAARSPLVGRVLPGGREERGELTRGLLPGDLPENLLLVSARPADDERGLILHLRETGGAEVRIRPDRLLSSEPIRGVALVDAVGGSPVPIDGDLVIPPYAVRFLLFELA